MAKLLTTLCFIVVTASFGRYDVMGLCACMFYPFVLMALSETPYSPLLKRLAFVLPFVLAAGAYDLFVDTKTISTLGGVAVSGGVVYFCALIMKTYLTVMALLLLAATTPMRAIASQMLRLGVPSVVVSLFTMVYRYVGVLLDEASSMYSAYMLRAPRAKGIKIRDMGSFVGQLLLRSADRAERVSGAMALRSPNGGVTAVSSRCAVMSVRDMLYFASASTFCVVCRLIL